MDHEVDLLSSAVRQLHTQAHALPSDTLYAETCLREPCRSVGHLLDIADDASGHIGLDLQAS